VSREHLPPRTTKDMDILVDLRLVPKGLRSMTRLVEGMGFRLKGVSPEGIGHRFERDGLVIDLLAPDGMGERADIGTVGSAVNSRPMYTGHSRLGRFFEPRQRTRCPADPMQERISLFRRQVDPMCRQAYATARVPGSRRLEVRLGGA